MEYNVTSNHANSENNVNNFAYKLSLYLPTQMYITLPTYTLFCIHCKIKVFFSVLFSCVYFCAYAVAITFIFCKLRITYFFRLILNRHHIGHDRLKGIITSMCIIIFIK